MVRTVGVEEELLLVDPRTGEPRARSTAVLAVAERRSAGPSAFEEELQHEQLEFATTPHTRMRDLAEEIRRTRAEAAQSAAAAGAAVVALATSPVLVQPSLGDGERHTWLADRFGETTQEQLTCGCHVHVSVESDEEGVGVLDRVRVWLPVLLALSANSPFWQGRDTAYDSYRSRVWGRWPSAGPVEVFGSARGYHDQVRALMETDVLRDPGMLYFDARLSHRYPTVEVRVADVCLNPDDTVLLATLVRGLVETAARAWRAGDPPDATGVSLLRMAAWQAGRCGLGGDLLHPATMRPEPARAVLDALLAHTADALENSADRRAAEKALSAVRERGTGARTQRQVFARTGGLGSMVAECVSLTRG
ncbi:glutamate--cysteine ligase [Streptomyces sp. NPDC059783]|uniref:glutamate--cysteine ligase n=1 Tax=Streptomyces sp. NPDC059783 TaxID=3346944 RepID=UPI003668E213